MHRVTVHWLDHNKMGAIPLSEVCHLAAVRESLLITSPRSKLRPIWRGMIGREDFHLEALEALVEGLSFIILKFRRVH
jgi:hypothetical protein